MCVKIELLSRAQKHIYSMSRVYFDLIDRIFHFVFLI